MKNLDKELKEMITKNMIPESKAFMQELQEEVKKGIADQDTYDAIKDMESFLVELEDILSALKANKLSDKEIQIAYDKLTTVIEEDEDDKD